MNEKKELTDVLKVIEKNNQAIFYIFSLFADSAMFYNNRGPG